MEETLSGMEVLTLNELVPCSLHLKWLQLHLGLYNLNKD